MLTDLVMLNHGIYGETEGNPKLEAVEKRARSIMRNTILELREI
jgi:hypothetical protein